MFLYYYLQFDPPEIKDFSVLKLERDTISENHYSIGNNWIRKNSYGLWEMYIEGDAFERGVIQGKLSKELVCLQEDAFVGQIDALIPSRTYQRFLQLFIAWFNRDLNQYVPEEYLKEIYGVSFSASDEYSHIGPKYLRILNYHAAHDIGHALKDLNLVACTSFAVWNGKSSDSTLLVGRNFDMYLGQDFAKDKIVAFINPTKGYRFAHITWGGMVGAVSGINEKGLTVTINAGRSDVPTGVKTPVSLVVREVLQYAENIEEAYQIIEKRELFVSESFLVSSVADNKAVVIERSPEKMGLYEVDTNFIVCSNHFQSAVFANDSLSKKAAEEGSSLSRYKRLNQLLNKYSSLTVQNAIDILRDRNGLDDQELGLGSERAMNQLLGHHSIVFKPEKGMFWISTKPWQLGPYVAYDLQRVFSGNFVVPYIDSLIIKHDPFEGSQAYKNYKKYLFQKEAIQRSLWFESTDTISNTYIDAFVKTNILNPVVYVLSGDVYEQKGNHKAAVEYYSRSLNYTMGTARERKEVNNKIRAIEKQLMN